MFELKFKDDKKALKRLAKVEKKIDKFHKSNSKDMTKRQHKKHRKLLKKRADALSDATGIKIHSLFD